MRAVALVSSNTDVLVRRSPGFLALRDRKSTRLNSSHGYISYAVFCLKKKKKTTLTARLIHNQSTNRNSVPSLPHRSLDTPHLVPTAVHTAARLPPTHITRGTYCAPG